MKKTQPRIIKTDIGRAIIAVRKKYKYHKTPVWLKRIADELKKQEASK